MWCNNFNTEVVLSGSGHCSCTAVIFAVVQILSRQKHSATNSYCGHEYNAIDHAGKNCQTGWFFSFSHSGEAFTGKSFKQCTVYSLVCMYKQQLQGNSRSTVLTNTQSNGNNQRFPQQVQPKHTTVVGCSCSCFSRCLNTQNHFAFKELRKSFSSDQFCLVRFTAATTAILAVSNSFSEFSDSHIMTDR